jgi:ATP-dependent Clp endopeptidase proteolytic subunit ClpP
VGDLNERLVAELIDNVKRCSSASARRLRDVYHRRHRQRQRPANRRRLREFANDNGKPITLYINSAGGNVTDGLAIHDAIRHLVHTGIEVTTVVQGMAYSMGSVVLQAASEGHRFAFPHSWIMIHEPAKWAGWQSTTAAAQHLERLKQMQDQIYKILSDRSKKPLRQIIRDASATASISTRRPRVRASTTSSACRRGRCRWRLIGGAAAARSRRRSSVHRRRNRRAVSAPTELHVNEKIDTGRKSEVRSQKSEVEGRR